MLERIAMATAVWIAATAALEAREIVVFDAAVEPGTVIVRTNERRLYYLQGDGTAIRYRVAVGRPGKQWFGRAAVEGKHVRPAWSPPEEVRRDKPSLPDVIPSGAPNNPKSIGTFASYGCIRMLNADIIDLFDRVAVGTEVLVTR